jgi:cytochrome c oxidase subunit 2
MVLFAIRYRKRSDADRTLPLAGSHRLEIIWSVIPAIGLFMMFWFGFRDFLAMRVVPDKAMTVRVTGQKWYWTFKYPDQGGLEISTAPELQKMAEDAGQELGLVVPVGKPVRLVQSSVDVLHSFFIPAFRIKSDVIPNRYTVQWFEATKEGVYDIFCTEYCGRDHSRMHTKVIVKNVTDFDAWVREQKARSAGPADGKTVFAKYGCTACHTTDGSALVGPSLKGVYGKDESLADGGSAKVDDNYIRESIMDPGKKVVAGFGPVMPTFAGRIEDKEVDALIDYIKSLQ